MPIHEVRPGKFRKFRYETAPRRRTIELKVEATNAINVYLVDTEHLEEWKRGRDYSGISFTRKRVIDEEIKLPRNFDDWFLIVENTGENPATVYFDVYE
jgi:hypothetical protein